MSSDIEFSVEDSNFLTEFASYNKFLLRKVEKEQRKERQDHIEDNYFPKRLEQVSKKLPVKINGKVVKQKVDENDGDLDFLSEEESINVPKVENSNAKLLTVVEIKEELAATAILITEEPERNVFIYVD